MKFGVFFFPTDYAMPIDELARALEDRGFEALFVPEHTHIPTSRRSPWPGGAELPREYACTLDPFLGLTMAAAVTTKLRIGTGICLLTERDPIVTAKEVATLDLLSKGRFEFGIGAGWNAEEMENHGTVFETRFRVMVDRRRSGQRMRPPMKVSSPSSIRSGPGRSPCKSLTRQSCSAAKRNILFGVWSTFATAGFRACAAATPMKPWNDSNKQLMKAGAR